MIIKHVETLYKNFKVYVWVKKHNKYILAIHASSTEKYLLISSEIQWASDFL